LIYAPLGSQEFQEFFAAEMREAGSATAALLGDNLASLWLGGGFGRGEGAVTHASGRELAHNDVDTFLFVHDVAKVDSAKLKHIEHEFSERLGAEFEFSRPLELGALSRIRPALMWFDVLNGHEVMAGTVDVAKRFSPELSKSVPPFEGPRLLLNRGAGLVWALRVHRGFEPAPDPDFIRRNVWKARLGLIEAALIVKGRYVYGIESKKKAFSELAPPLKMPLFRPEAVSRAFNFKLDPDQEKFAGSEIEAIVPAWVDAFLEVEGLRFGADFESAGAYQTFSQAREPGEIKDKLRNLARNAKSGKFGAEHPREPLYRKLPSLLMNRTASWAQDSEAFLNDWRRFC